jgi:hypothetical protein
VSTFADALQSALREGETAGAVEASAFDDHLNRLERALAGMTHPRLSAGPRPAWSEELGVELPCDRQDIVRAFRRLAFRTHPDRAGGSHEAFLRAQSLLEEALAWLRDASPRTRAARFHDAPRPVASRSFYA